MFGYRKCGSFVKKNTIEGIYHKYVASENSKCGIVQAEDTVGTLQMEDPRFCDTLHFRIKCQETVPFSVYRNI